MSRQISITLSDWVYDTYLSSLAGNNRSRYIEGLIVKGSELQTGEFETVKNKNLSLIQELRNKDDEIAKLKRQVGKLPTEEEAQRITAEKIIEGFQKTDLWRHT